MRPRARGQRIYVVRKKPSATCSRADQGTRLAPVLVFTRTKHGANRLAEQLTRAA